MAKAQKSNTDWIKIKPAEMEKLVIELSKKGLSPSQIGLELRDKHGIPKAKLVGKRITKILRENKINYKTDKEGVKGIISNVEKHTEKNKHDYTAKRALTKQLWVLHKLERQ